jgi:hypothetical protein
VTPEGFEAIGNHHDRVKHASAGAGCASNEPPFLPRFPEQIGRPDFKNSTRKGALLFDFCE